MTLTSTVATTETIGSLETNTPAADALGFVAGSLEMDWSHDDAVMAETHAKSFIHVIGTALLLSACLWAAIFGLIQLV